MVQVLKEEIANRIFEAAAEEFYQRGFKGATMRNIAKAADIAVGLVYSYYENKKTLFSKVVEPVYALFEYILTHDHDELQQQKQDSNLFDELKELLYIFKTKRKAFVILIDKSSGTKYENVKQDIIHMTKMHIQESLSAKLSEDNKGMDDFFYHILANNFMESIFEIGRHYKDEKWAEQMLNLVAKQYFYGVNSF